MSTAEASIKAEYLNEISDSIAAMVACVLQEQLAPILETVREHSRLLDWHSALLNHSTIMNRYNVGKLDDLRDLQTNVNYKLQFHIDPEDRKHPSYRGLPPAPVPQHTVVAMSTEPSPQPGESPPSPAGCSSGVSSLDCTDSSSGASSATRALDPQSRQATPVFESPANNSPPPTPPQVTAQGCAVSTKRQRLQRECAHGETSDPMWNSSRRIDLSIPIPAPIPPYVPPPSYADRVSARCSETSEATTTEASPTAQLNERVAGKKRKREDDTSEAHITGTSESGSLCDKPERKRKKDTTISTERVPIPESFLRVARLNIFGEPSFEERRCEVEQMRYLKNLFRGGAT